MRVDLVEDAAAWKSACEGSAFVALRTDRIRLVTLLMAIYLTCYLGFAVLCGFAKGWLGLKVFGALNLGYVLIFGNYVVAWALALVYVRRANKRYDDLAAAAIAEHTATMQRSLALA